MAKATGQLPRIIYSHCPDQDTYIAYSPLKGICICPEDDMERIEMYEDKVKFEGTRANTDYEFAWLVGEIEMRTTEGLEIIQFTDIIKIQMP
jgi:hypothetical protein